MSLLKEDEEINALSKPIKDSIKLCVDRSNELKEMISKIIDFVQMSGGGHHAAKSNIKLKKYLTGFMESSVKDAGAKKTEYDILCNNENISIDLPKPYLDIVMTNLIQNAIQFNDKNFIKFKIEVRSSDNQANISFSDNGPGIPPEEYEKIFEKFYQIDKWFTGNIKGWGLGLAIVKQIITSYEGKITVNSKLGEGTTFTITFPIVQM